MPPFVRLIFTSSERKYSFATPDRQRLTRHRSSLEDAKLYGNTSESQAASYDRDHPLYPYKSHGQWLKACYGMVGCIILILFNGVSAFIEPFNIRKFVSAYISVGDGCLLSRPTLSMRYTCTDSNSSIQLPTFLILIVGYNLRKHGLRIRDWWTDKSGDLSNTVQATSLKRKGRLEFPDNGVTRENLLAIVEWIWVWMK